MMKNSIPRDFAAEQRRGLLWSLAYGASNSVFSMWTFFGSVFLLFLDALGLPKGQIGMLLALFPFCGLLALGFAPVAARWGRKRVFLATFFGRKVVTAALLLLPWLLLQGGRNLAVVYLFGIVIVFAVLRALGETAYYPWSQEFVPNQMRGKFAAWSTVLGMLVSCLALVAAGRVLGAGEGLNRFLWLIGAGSLCGVVGVGLMAKVPGGAPVQEEAATGTHLAKLAAALGDRNFTAYLGGLGAVTVGTALLVCFLPLYLKNRLGLPAGTIVQLDAVAMVGGALSSLAWGGLADRVGSRPVLMPAAALSLLLPLGWLLLPRQTSHLVAWCAALYFLYGVASSGVAIGAGRLLFNGVVPPAKSTAYTAIYYAWMGITGGVGPLLAGGLLSLCRGWQAHLGPVVLDGHSLLFALALVLLALGWALYGRVRPDDIYTTRGVLQQLLGNGTRTIPNALHSEAQ